MRSGAVAQGLYAINCYMGMQWNENQPEDQVRYDQANDAEDHGTERKLNNSVRQD